MARLTVVSVALDRINQIESHLDRFDQVAFEFSYTPAMRGSGAWNNLGSLGIDQAFQLSGLPEAISATLPGIRQRIVADDWFQAVLQYPDKRVILHGSLIVNGGVARFTMHGDFANMVKGYSDNQAPHLRPGILPGTLVFGVVPDPPIEILPDGHSEAWPVAQGDCRAFNAALDAAIRGEACNPAPVSEAVDGMTLREAVS